jgi:hypothetical protein
MQQLPAAPPPPPTITAAARDASGAVRLTWKSDGEEPATSFAVYRVDTAAPEGEPARLVASVRAAGDDTQVWTDTAATAAAAYTYCVTGLDRSWNEGGASEPRAAASTG